MRKYGGKKVSPNHYDDTVDQAAPVQNTYYELFHLYNFNPKAIALKVADTGESVQVRVTVDGTVYTGVATAVNANEWVQISYLRIQSQVPILTASSGNIDMSVQFANTQPFWGHEITIEWRKTTANGAGTITGQVVGDQW